MMANSGGVIDISGAEMHQNGESNLKKGPWTAEEDAVLVEYVRKHGEGNWNAVQRHSGLARCGKSCRLRWANHLRPNLKKGAFSPAEERLIVELHAKFGNKWARMATLLPGRTDNEIKNYWNTRVKRHQRQGIPLYPPDIQPHHPPSPHFHHLPSPSAALPTSSFTFQTQFPTSTTPTSATPPPLSPANTSTSFPTLLYSQHHLHNHHYSSTPTTPSSCFSFPTQLRSPNHRTPSTPPALSPLSSPSTNPNSFSNPTLPLFDFNAPRAPPILQSPIRFKRFASNPELSNLVNASHQFNLNTSSNSHFSSTMGHQLPLYSLNNTTGGDFHSEMQKENQEMCSLLASITHPELSSNQFTPNHQHHQGRNLGINGIKVGRRMNKRKYGNGLNDKMNEKLSVALMEELLQDCGQNPTDSNNFLMQDQKTKMSMPEGFYTHWDQPNLQPLTLDLDEKVEGEKMNTVAVDELSKVLNTVPTMQSELYNDSATDTSNGQSSVLTNDNMGFEMQQIAAMFPPTEHDKGLETCSWDNLPGIC